MFLKAKTTNVQRPYNIISINKTYSCFPNNYILSIFVCKISTLVLDKVSYVKKNALFLTKCAILSFALKLQPKKFMLEKK